MSFEANIRHAIAGGMGTGAAWAVVNRQEITYGFAGTLFPHGPPVDANALFDLASLTKVMSTMQGVWHSGIGLDHVVAKGQPLHQYLTHTTGLEPYMVFEEPPIDPNDARRQLLAVEPFDWPSNKSVYSCLGFIHLFEHLIPHWEPQFGQFQPIERSRCVVTQRKPEWRRHLEKERGEDGWDEEFIQGRVHDPLAYLLGGRSGNAGLFGTISEVASFAQSELKAQDDHPERFVPWRNCERCLGWNWDPASKCPFHTGYTGTSIHFDSQMQNAVVLLTNRVYPDDSGTPIDSIRQSARMLME